MSKGKRFMPTSDKWTESFFDDYKRRLAGKKDDLEIAVAEADN